MNFNFIGTLVNDLLRRSSNKESEDEILDAPDRFTVRKPNWMIPVLLLASAVFVGFAVFSFRAKVSIAGVFFILFALASLFALIWENSFSVHVEGNTITLRTLFGKERIFFAEDITSCHIDNAGNVKVDFESGKISVDGMLVNAGLFSNFAQGWLYKNLEAQKPRAFKIRRKKSELILMLFSDLVAALMLSIFILHHRNFSVKDMILAFSIFGGILIASLFYFPIVKGSYMTVDEKSRTFSYTKGLRRYTANFSDVIEARTKNRLGEANAVNYIITIYQIKNGKSRTVRKRFSSLDENASRFVFLLLKEFERYEEERAQGMIDVPE